MARRQAHKDSREMTLIVTHGKGNNIFYQMADNKKWTLPDGTLPFHEIPNNTYPFHRYKEFILNSGLEIDTPYWVWSIRHPKIGMYYWVAFAPLNHAGAVDWAKAKYYDDTWKPAEVQRLEETQSKQKPVNKSLMDLITF